MIQRLVVGTRASGRYGLLMEDGFVVPDDTGVTAAH